MRKGHTVAPYEKDELLRSSNSSGVEKSENEDWSSDDNNNRDLHLAPEVEEEKISVLSYDDEQIACCESTDSVVNIESNVEDEMILDDKPYFDSVSLSEPCCRVCQCNSNEERLINPCFCSGSVKWIHESCLIQWMKSSLKDSCELCTKKIKIAKRRKPLSKVRLSE